jgi:hypothetical protein
MNNKRLKAYSGWPLTNNSSLNALKFNILNKKVAVNEVRRIKRIDIPIGRLIYFKK